MAQMVEPGFVVDSADLAQEIISSFESLAKSGMLGASVGDVSLRVPGADSMLITPLTPLVEHVDESDLIEVGMNGRLLHKRGRPTFSMQMHLAIYKQRPDVNAIVHCHAPVSTVLGICELPIPPVTFDAIPFVDLPRVPAAIVQDGQWAHEVAAHLAGGAPAALLLNNGIVAVGEDARQAVRRTLALEETARILVVCYLLQQVPVALPSQAVEILRDSLL
jgi:ribulose-5-phosphate 4-epimerase/fuculose-1-phosphate aldolase